jgi:hypothetical protein
MGRPVSVTFVECYTVIDKSEWGPGPWQDEPDKAVWVDVATDLDCMAVRHDQLGYWCGYVGVPFGHPAYGRDPFAGDDDDVAGLTYGNLCQPHEDGPANGICHLAQPGRPEHVYWLGFDCGHFDELAPALVAWLDRVAPGQPHFAWQIYKPIGYVIERATELAAQLHALEKRTDDVRQG